MDSIPVVVVHTGLKPYVEPCLRRAVASNPRGRVVLLGDAANAGIGIGEHHRLDDASLATDLAEFRKVYEHHSSSKGEQFERFCIERWFFVRNFMRRENLDRCLVIDTDVLLFCDVATEAARFRHAGMTFARWDAVRLLPHCNFIGGRAAIESFCDYALGLYRDASRLEAVKAKNGKKFGRHWVSDMSLFADWSARGGCAIGMLEDAVHDGVAFDDAIDRTRGYVRRSFMPGVLRPWKWIEYRDGVPFARHRRAGEVPMKCLHFHGGFKDLMGRHAECLTDDWAAATIMLRRKLKSVPGKTAWFTRNYLAPLRTDAAPGVRRAA